MPKKKSISKVKKKIKSVRKKVLKKIEEKELIIKTKPEWVKSALVNKAKYQKKYSDSIKNNDIFWKNEGVEYKVYSDDDPYGNFENLEITVLNVEEVILEIIDSKRFYRVTANN